MNRSNNDSTQPLSAIARKVSSQKALTGKPQESRHSAAMADWLESVCEGLGRMSQDEAFRQSVVAKRLSPGGNKNAIVEKVAAPEQPPTKR